MQPGHGAAHGPLTPATALPTALSSWPRHCPRTFLISSQRPRDPGLRPQQGAGAHWHLPRMLTQPTGVKANLHLVPREGNHSSPCFVLSQWGPVSLMSPLCSCLLPGPLCSATPAFRIQALWPVLSTLQSPTPMGRLAWCRGRPADSRRQLHPLLHGTDLSFIGLKLPTGAACPPGLCM